MLIEGIIYRLRREGKSTFKAMYGLIKRTFYDNIPSDDIKDLPASSAFSLGAVVYLFVLASFAALFATGYIDDVSQKFLAVTKDAGSCDKVPKIVTGTYLADSNGLWESSPQFEYTKALYSFSFPGFSGSSVVYRESLDKAFDSMQYLGNASYSSNLAGNVLYWMAFSGSLIAGGSSNIFRMNGSPRVLFDKTTYFGSFSSRAGVCPVHPHISYDSGGSTLRLELSYSNFTANSLCRSIVSPEHMGYSATYGLDRFSFSIDAQTLLTAVAVNLELLTDDDLELVPYSSFLYDYKGEDITLGKYFYPRYPAMKPLFCMSLASGKLLCTLQYYNLYLYPLFNHAGYSPFSPQYCDCDNPEIGQSEACNLFNFFAGFAFFDYDESAGEIEQTAIDKLIDGTLTRTAEYVNRASFNASFDAVSVNLGNDLFSDSTWRRDAYSFCEHSDGSSCSMLTVLLSQGYTVDNSTPGIVDTPNIDSTVSDHYYQLMSGSCNDSFSISEESMSRLKETPPQPLEESYYECTPSRVNAVINAWGIASSNAEMLAPVIVTLVLALFISYQNKTKKQVPRTYSASERADALNYLAFALLKARDGHYEGSDEDIICRLRSELGAHERTSRFYCERADDDTIPKSKEDDDDGDVEMKSSTEEKGKKALVQRYESSSDFDTLPNPIYSSKSD